MRERVNPGSPPSERTENCKYSSYSDGEFEAGADSGNPARPPIPQKKIVEFWNAETAEPLGLQRRRRPGALRESIRAKWSIWREEAEDGDPWTLYQEIRDRIHDSAFLRGEKGGSDSWKGASFEFVFKRADRWQQILEGKYQDRESESPNNDFGGAPDDLPSHEKSAPLTDLLETRE